MTVSRREFLAAGMAAAAAMYGGCGVKGGRETGELPGVDGSELWLRYGAELPALLMYVDSVRVYGRSPATDAARQELQNFGLGFGGAFLAENMRELAREYPPGMLPPVSIVAGSAQALPASLGTETLAAEAFSIRRQRVGDGWALVIRGGSDAGMLYGVFHFLRLAQCGALPPGPAITVPALEKVQAPRYGLRVVNHWDNLDGSIERGYAGKSLWNWAELPGKVSRRMIDYARANASIGINGAVLNNVNASATFLSAEYLKKAAGLAEAWRPYGLKVYLAINFSSPVLLDKLATADPLNAEVAAWWKRKADEIYELMPDFGGFLVKANSEGQPGPQDFGRTHAQGANMLADALAPHGGNVIWRAFIYDEDVDPDRAKRAYIEFMKLDGQFRPNVLLQVKNGPIDFQPREPFHPLFGALARTPVMAEVQATQEYTGQAKHLVYLGTMWKEFMEADTGARGPGTPVKRTLSGMACVLNTGSDANWCGHDFSQANWYAFGRLAWDPDLSAEAIAREWVRQTWTAEEGATATIVDMMMRSRETYVDYTMPLGLHHLIGGDHYAPMPWNAEAPRKDWTAVYYHQASKEGIGFDRTRKGDKAVAQYFPPVADQFDDLGTCPEKFLLWFHRVAWDYKMKSGRTLWEELVRHYEEGARQAAGLGQTWAGLATAFGIDPRRHAAVARRLAIQGADAALWRDKILDYFGQFSGMPR